MRKVSRHVVALSRMDVVSGGPDIPVVLAEVQLTDEGGKSLFYTLAEVECCPMILRTKESIFDELSDRKSEFQISPKTIIFNGDYEELFDGMPKKYEAVIRYLVYLVRADYDEANAFIAETGGKILEELDIPVSDVEEDLEEEDWDCDL